MKFFATAITAVVGLSGLAAARPQDGTITSAPAAAATFDAAYSSTLSCITACGAGNVYCQAGCQGLPVPDEGALNATHDCVAACPPGGDEEKNAAWAACQQKCVSSLYYTASVPYSSYVPPTAVGFSSNAPQTTGTSGSAEETAESGSSTSAKATGSDATKTDGPAPTQSPNAGSYVIANIPMLGAFLLAALAL